MEGHLGAFGLGVGTKRTNEKKPVGQAIPLSGWTRGKIVCSRGGARYRARGSTDHLLLAVDRKCISSEEFGTWGNTIPMGMWDRWRSQPGHAHVN